MKAFLIWIAALHVFAAFITINTKPGSPRPPHGSARALMVTLLIELGVACWALLLLWSGA